MSCVSALVMSLTPATSCRYVCAFPESEGNICWNCQGLTEIPDIPTEAISVQLLFNSISSIPDGIFSELHSLKLLDLGINEISEIGSGRFIGLEALEDLHLKYNRISSVQGGIFSQLKKLKYLVLSQNQICHIDSDAFDGLNSLESLSLNENKLAVVSPGTLNHLSSLETLYLYHNWITTIDSDTFDGLDSLKNLN